MPQKRLARPDDKETFIGGRQVSFTDKTLNCVDCGAEFVFTAGEQEFHASRGFTNEPKRCPDCRRARKAGGDGGVRRRRRGALWRVLVGAAPDVPGDVRELRPRDRGAVPAARRPPGVLPRLLPGARAERWWWRQPPVLGGYLSMALPSTASVDDVVAALDRDGYCIVEGVLSPEEVQAKRDDLIGVLQSTPTGRNDFEGFKTQRIYNLYAKTRAFDGPAMHPLVLGVLDKVLGHYQFSAPVGISIGPGETAQVLHTDDGVYPLPRPHGEVVMNTMWPLDPFTKANGATRVVPGSHTSSERPPDDAPVVDAEMVPGSVMFFRGSVFHGGGTNSTDRPRLGVILEYCASWLRPQENHVIGVPKDVVRTLEPRLQELLGYNVHPRSWGMSTGGIRGSSSTTSAVARSSLLVRSDGRA